MSKYLSGLNGAQKQAVTSDSKYILCLAGAGTGKTRTLTHRIAHLHDERISCTNMLALTFTRLAGKEMKERVIHLVGESEGKKLFCNTFHAFCVKVIREWGHLLGYEGEFTIYDQEDRESIIKTIIQEFSLNVKCKDILKLLEGAEIDDKEVQEGAKEYYYRLKRNNAIDLDMLLAETSRLLQYPQVQEEYNQQYEYVFVDEFQDTNDIQMAILRTLDPQNLFVVGDDFQAIYGWRNAKIDYILNFSKTFPGCEIIKLEENYRSTFPIVNAANKLIRFNFNQSKKVLINDKDGPTVKVLTLENAEGEAQYIAGEILELEGDFKDCAVLARTNRQLELIKQTLDAKGIPNEAINNQGDIFKKSDIKKVIQFIELSLNPKGDVLLRQVVNFPDIRVTPMELQQAELKAIDSDQSLNEVLKESPKAQSFFGMLQCLWEDDQTNEATEIFRKAVSLLNLKQQYYDQGRKSKVDDLDFAISAIGRWAARQEMLGEDPTIQSFLKWQLLKDIQEKLAEEKDTVKLMTVHAAKGLEFKNVFVIGMNQNTFPSHRAEDLEEERRLFYVAITRAKESLYITRPENVTAWGSKEVMALPSQFISEMDT